MSHLDVVGTGHAVGNVPAAVHDGLVRRNVVADKT
jgi:hypothetical protein